MKEIKQDCYKGTRILLGDGKRQLINKMIDVLHKEGFTEIQMPVIQYQEIFKGKVGEENNNLMFNFQDRGERDLCLAPEYTAVIQRLAKDTWKYEKDKKVFYVQECFRGENPQAGRWRQFTQLGVEIINPKDPVAMRNYNKLVALRCLDVLKDYGAFKFGMNQDVTRGLDYYKEGKGFEICADELGSSKQICGGGEYDGGVGFAIGIDRLLMLFNQST